MLVIGIMGIVVVLMAIQFKSIKPEYGIMISVVGCAFIFLYSLVRVNEIVEMVERLAGITSVSREYKNYFKNNRVTFYIGNCFGYSKGLWVSGCGKSGSDFWQIICIGYKFSGFYGTDFFYWKVIIVRKLLLRENYYSEKLLEKKYSQSIIVRKIL